jgi:GNAT superfamily N-acetyltransferase
LAARGIRPRRRLYRFRRRGGRRRNRDRHGDLQPARRYRLERLGAVPARSLRRSGLPHRGIARALLARVAALARDIGSPIIELTVRADNPAAQEFYRRSASGWCRNA